MKTLSSPNITLGNETSLQIAKRSHWGSLLAALFFLFGLFGHADAQTFTEGFEGGFPLTWSISSGVWQVGSPTVVGPAAAHEGSNCLTTNISGNC